MLMIPIDQEQIQLLERRLRGAGVDRRTFLKIAAAASSGPVAASLLAACGGGDDDDDDDDEAATEPTATTAPAGQADPTATTEPAEEEDTGEEATPTMAEEEEAEEATPTEADGEETTTEEEQIFYDDYRTSDPASHDFNADLYCNGFAAMWAGMGTFDPDFNAVPDWAEWEPNEDASVWTFHIRPDNTGFSNGDPVTAEVFAYSWKRLLTPETAAPYSSLLFDIRNAEAINLEGMDPEELGTNVIDDWTLEVEMEGPRGVFPIVASYIAAVPCHPPSVQANPDTWTDPNQVDEVVSNGPWKLISWEHDVRLELEKNENYWDAENIRLERVIEPIIPQEQGILPYENGDVDYAIVPGPDLQRVLDDPEMSEEYYRYVAPGTWFLLPQVTQAPFDQLEVRTAVSHAIDRERIVEVTNGLGQPAHSLMPPGLFGYFDDEEVTGIQDFDLDKAMAALEGTEFEGGQNWPPIEMTLRQEQYNSQIMAEDIAAQLEENLGMDIQINIMERNAFYDALFNLELQFIFIRWFYDYPDPNNGYFDMFYSNVESGRRQAWSNEQFDELTIQAKEEVDPERRLELYRECEIIMQEERAYIPTTYWVIPYVFKPWVQDIPVNQQGFRVPNGNIYVRMLSDIYVEGRPQQ